MSPPNFCSALICGKICLRDFRSKLGPKLYSSRASSPPNNAAAAGTTLKSDSSSKNKIPPWKDSASIVLAAPNPDKTSKTPKYLLMKRSGKSRFLPDTWCFPGGQTSSADRHTEWVDFFQISSGTNIRNDLSFSLESASRPLIYTLNEMDLGDRVPLAYMNFKFPKQLSLRITAIREMFEECGILLCRQSDPEMFYYQHGQGSPLGLGKETKFLFLEDEGMCAEWQERVRKDPREFFNLCKSLKCLPDVNALVDWSNWLTPNSLAPRRFDTIFYMVTLPHVLPLSIDGHEVSEAAWVTANEAIMEANEGRYKLIPPQIYELSRLKSTTLERINRLTKIRLELGIERICPCYMKVSDGMLSILPGDDLYPTDYEIERFEQIREIDLSLEELRESTLRHHRIELRTQSDFQLVVNVGPRLGQIYM